MGANLQFEFMKDVVTANTQRVVAAKKIEEIFHKDYYQTSPSRFFSTRWMRRFYWPFGCYDLI